MDNVEKATHKLMIPLKEASELTGLSYSCIRKLCLSNEIRFIRSGSKYYVNTASLMQYCERGCTA